MHSWRGWQTDMAVASRRLGQAPGFALVCILTLAIGIGSNTAIFTLIDRVLLEPLPVPRPSELYRLGDTDACCVNSGLQGSFALFSADLYRHLRDAAPAFTHVAAFQANTAAMTLGRAEGERPPETLDGSFVSGNFFQMFELVPAAGRLLQPSDDQPAAPAAAVISHRAWVERFGGRPDVGGTAVMLNGVAATIVGVAPRGFYGAMLRPDPAEVWVPIAQEPRLQPASRLVDAKGAHWLYAIGRLPPGAGAAAVQSQLTAALRQWLGSALDLSPDERRRLPQQHITVVAAARGVNSMRDFVARPLALLQALAAAVLLIACANLANLLLARGLARRTETAVRAALGAPRARLVALSLLESLLLAGAGGLAGLLLAYAGARAVIAMVFRGAAHVPIDPSPSPLVFGFALAVSLATALLFGSAPALFGSRSDPIDALRGAGRATADRGRWVRRSLVVVQVALSLVLVTCAGLLGRSLHALQAQDFGFRIDRHYTVALAPSLATIPAGQLAALYPQMQQRLARIPGVSNAAFSLYAPMSGDNWSSPITVEGHDTTARLTASWNRVSPRYFDTVGTPLLRGRALDDQDRPGAPAVAVVSQSFATRFFAGADPIGRRIGFTDAKGTGTPNIEIVGIVRDAKYQDGRAAPYPTFFVPFLQAPSGAPGGGSTLDRSHYPQAIVLSTTGTVAGLEGEVRRALAAADRRIIVRAMLPMAEQVAGHFNLDRLIARLTVVFGGVALLLACLGLYGVTAHAVSRRTREIGIRVAVGASRRQVLGTILRGALMHLAIGAAIGLPGALAAGRFLQSRLFGVSAADPAVLIGALILLALACLVAALIPARRAATLDPIQALRID